MEGPVERNGQGHGFNWELASSTEDPVEDGRSSKELQPVEEQGRKTVLKCRGHCTKTLAVWSSQ